MMSSVGMNRIGLNGVSGQGVSAMSKKAEQPQAVRNTQKPEIRPEDVTAKNIKNDISDVERQKQAVSSKSNISDEEKRKIHQDLQQELASLKTKLRLNENKSHQEVRKEELKEEISSKDVPTQTTEQKKAPEVSLTTDKKAAADQQEMSLGTVQTGNDKQASSAGQTEKQSGQTGVQPEEKADRSNTEKAKDTDRKNSEQTGKDMQSVVEAGNAVNQSKVQGTVVARIEDDIVIRKNEIDQDKARGVDVTRAEEDLKAEEERAQNALNAEFSAIGQMDGFSQGSSGSQPLIRATNYAIEGVV